MTKLHEAVRGVEVKELMPMVTDYRRGHKTVDFIKGYNSLAQAEVVVDRETLKDIILEIASNHPHRNWGLGIKGYDSVSMEQRRKENLKHWDLLVDAIATAIESGAIISLKEKE